MSIYCLVQRTSFKEHYRKKLLYVACFFIALRELTTMIGTRFGPAMSLLLLVVMVSLTNNPNQKLCAGSVCYAADAAGAIAERTDQPILGEEGSHSPLAPTLHKHTHSTKSQPLPPIFYPCTVVLLIGSVLSMSSVFTLEDTSASDDDTPTKRDYMIGVPVLLVSTVCTSIVFQGFSCVALLLHATPS